MSVTNVPSAGMIAVLQRGYLKEMLKKRIAMSLLGVLVCAAAVGVFKAAALGVDPFQSFMSGLNLVIPIEFGTLYIIVNVVLLLFSLIADRHNIGIATVLNLTLFGYIAQFIQNCILGIIPQPSLPVRFLMLAVGFVVLCLGSAVYMTADLGVSTYDSLANTMAYKWKIGPFKYVRIGTDTVCVILGAILGLLGGAGKGITAFIGIGTIMTAFFMGPLIDFFNRKVARPMLGKAE